MPDPHRGLQGVPLSELVVRIARRASDESSERGLRAVADLRAAVEFVIRENIAGRLSIDGPEHLLQEVLADGAIPRTWADIGADLGVSAQAVQRKYQTKAGDPQPG